jgi:alkylresorcinol/alkylpyrone synthase
MPKLIDVVTAKPPYRVSQNAAADVVRGHFSGSGLDVERLLQVFGNAGIETRYFCAPPTWLQQPHTLAEKNARYIDAATELCATAGRELLARRDLDPEAIDNIIYVNTTGLATPSIDARLINVLGLRRTVTRTPIWGLGCAGGVSGLSHAIRYLLGHPEGRVLLFAAEMCSLTFLPDDFSLSNFVATALFADGAAVALLSGDDTVEPGYPLLASRSVLYPDSLHLMGWNVVERGLQVVFDQRIPDIILAHGAAELASLLHDNSTSRDDVAEYFYHPGGPKVLAAYAQAYGIEPSAFRWSRDILRECGNMSSATILYVLERYLRAHGPRASRARAVISALGPGFSSESVIMGL